MGFHSSILALELEEKAKGSFFLAHAIITMSFGLPLSYLLALIGKTLECTSRHFKCEISVPKWPKVVIN